MIRRSRAVGCGLITVYQCVCVVGSRSKDISSDRKTQILCNTVIYAVRSDQLSSEYNVRFCEILYPVDSSTDNGSLFENRSDFHRNGLKIRWTAKYQVSHISQWRVTPCVSVEFIENSYRTSFSSLDIPSYMQNSKQCNNVMQLLNVDCCAPYIREEEFVPLLSVMYG